MADLAVPTLALSLTQPWASLMAFGVKRYETRSWGSRFRGALAIHASKRFPEWARSICLDEPFVSALHGAGFRFMTCDEFPLGAIVAVGRLADCEEIHRDDALLLSRTELAFGDFAPGRWMWKLVDVRRLAEPVPCRGALGLWTVPRDVQASIGRQLARGARCAR